MDNILVIRLKAIGDVIFTLPAVAALRAQFPAAKISFLVSKENAELLDGFRDVDKVIALDRAALRSRRPQKMGGELVGLLRGLRIGKFSLAVDFQGFGETALMARLTGASERWGTVYGKGRSWAYTRGVVRDESLHPADWNLKLLSDCGVKCGTAKNEFSLPAAAISAAKIFYRDNALDPKRKTLVIQPFTSTKQKNWPLENFLGVARHWRERGVQVVFVGGVADGERLETVRSEGFCVATNLPLLVSGGVVQLATLLLGGDTGLGHLAVAQGRRVVMLMMHQSAGACVPYRHPEWAVVPEKPGKIQRIEIETVIAETAKAL